MEDSPERSSSEKMSVEELEVLSNLSTSSQLSLFL